jgi:O-antigen/teichoic acid export membrane protein
MLKRNVIANYIGNAWAAAMSFVFVPAYIRFLGIEAYGVVGLFALLSTWLALLDMGMSTTLSREMSRFSAGQLSVDSIKGLLRTAEVFFAGVALVLTVILALGSHWLAANWLNTEQLAAGTVEDAIKIMGIVMGLRFIEGVYRSSLGGLQRQVALNIANVGTATLRSLGAYVVLATVSPSLTAFFAWQVITSVVSLTCMMVLTYRVLPRGGMGTRVSWQAIRDVRGFAGGVFALTILSLLLSQLDKVLLSKLLPLSAFGHYSFAATVAGIVFFLVSPISQSIYPRLCELHARGDQAQFSAVYHKGAQLLAIIAGCAGAVLAFFSDSLLLLWTGDAALTGHAAALVSLLALGNLLNALMVLPYQVQLAHGWTALLIKTNLVALVLLTPATIVAVHLFGPIGAAAVWLALNSSYVIFLVHLMHRRIMPDQKRYWYVHDVGLPLCAIFLIVSAGKLAMPHGLSSPALFIYILATGLLAAIAAIASTPFPRRTVTELLRYRSELATKVKT